ncbi:4Fe-4S binding protein [Thermococcus thermotolerans]|uniref:4Fe-4S binding protein n=1 Tax=Thermococcus thermotolerans TaxID=2969672 RepID=UPI00215832AA|nr:4Fe-4S binding protein [Thermococcus thermotolerans]
MKVPPTLSTVLGNLFKKPATNPFPESEPVPVPEGFRGKLNYDVEKCVGCRLCVMVCPAGVIEYVPEVRKVTFWLGRCVFCAQCVDVCPVNALWMSDEFLLATTDKYEDNLMWFHGEEIEEFKKKLEEQKKAKESAKKEAPK